MDPATTGPGPTALPTRRRSVYPRGVPEWERTGSPGAGRVVPRAPLGHLARLDASLAEALDVDDVAEAVLEGLIAQPEVARVGVALTEGGGRRLRFTQCRAGEAADTDWCHIDAYDDVPLTAVVRSGEPMRASIDVVEERWPWLGEAERARGNHALAAVPLPGTGSPIGGLLLVYDRPQEFDRAQRDLVEAVARRTAETIVDLRARRSRDQADELSRTEAAAEPGARTASMQLPPEPTAPGRARAFLREELVAWGIDAELVDTAQLCLSEVVTNAVNHAHTPADVRVSLLDGVLTVLVRDRGAEGDVIEPTREEDPLVVYGRGLMLVEALTDRWGSERDAGGTTVWFALDLDRRDPEGSP